MDNKALEATSINYRNLFYPPGGILIWIVIILEVTVFGAGMIAFSKQGSLTPDIFSQSRALLNPNIGLANTIILLTSGFFVARSVHHLKEGNQKESRMTMWAACILGFAFLLLKGIEFAGKANHGFDIAYDSFFMYYWLLAGFHYIHVLIGLVILLFMLRGISKGSYHKSDFLDVESGAAFWHMCDWIWLMLFPLLYLL
ncbi:MAG: nitric oxide reductase [Bacteroidetes bacterium]|nr:nitric oxide reductase [Bacteroidota bacterium]